VPVFCSKTRKMFLKNVGSSRRGAETTVFVVNRYQFYWVSSEQVDLMTSSALDLSCGNLSLYCWQRALMCIVVELSFVMLLAADMTGACDTKLTLFISSLEILLLFYVLLPRLYIRHSTFCARSSVSRSITTSQIQMYFRMQLATLYSHCFNGKSVSQQYT